MQQDTNAGRALRALQQLDQFDRLDNRHLLIVAQDALGAELGLECTGACEGAVNGFPFYDHSGNTCPIHEWLVPEDAENPSTLAGPVPA